MESLESIVWNTKVPLRIILSSADRQAQHCACTAQLHVSTSTISFLPIIIPQVQKHFKPETENTNQLWFSYQGSPIRWHLPIGILLDLYRVQNDLWVITVHFSAFPKDEIENLDTSAIESSFRMSIKEADQIRTRSERSNTFQSADYKRLWSSVVESSLTEWKTVAHRLLSGSSEDRNVPLKFHYDCAYFQTPVETGDETVGEVLQRALPASITAANFKVFYFGCELESNTPIATIKSLTYADTFIHLVLQSIH